MGEGKSVNRSAGLRMVSDRCGWTVPTLGRPCMSSSSSSSICPNHTTPTPPSPTPHHNTTLIALQHLFSCKPQNTINNVRVLLYHLFSWPRNTNTFHTATSIKPPPRLNTNSYQESTANIKTGSVTITNITDNYHRCPLNFLGLFIIHPYQSNYISIQEYLPYGN